MWHVGMVKEPSLSAFRSTRGPSLIGLLSTSYTTGHLINYTNVTNNNADEISFNVVVRNVFIYIFEVFFVYNH